MKLLFVHQGFPGQYIHILRSLAVQGGHQLVGLGIQESAELLPPEVQYFRYQLSRGNEAGLHPWVQDIETKVLRAEPCARAATKLKKQGFVPDLICGHPGWGEMLFLRDVWPNVPILSYQEFFYNPRGYDYDFDPELQGEPNWESCAQTRIKNANQLLNLEASTWCVTPTQFQKSTYPDAWKSKISVIHDGIDTNKARPNPNPVSISLADGTTLNPDEKIVTFVNRTLEPYRGCHTMIRALPFLLDKVPDAKVLIIGETSGVSYGASCPQGEWKDVFLAEIEGDYDSTRVHFVGKVAYDQFIPLLQLSKAHVYLTYPFVLSWSLLEAMSCGCAVVASSTAPVIEVVEDERNGLLIDFFDPKQLASAVARVLNDYELAANLGRAARQTILKRFQLKDCVQSQLALMHTLATGGLK